MDRSTGENNKTISKVQIALFCFYIFLSFFETYLTPFIGNATKFYLLFVLAIILYQERFKIKLNYFWVCYLIWFIYKFGSIAWSNMSNTDVSTHLLSQIGMVLFVIIMVGRKQNSQLLRAILQTNLLMSFLFGILSIFFKGAFISENFVARQVLTLFGQQNDPNNCAAFLLVGITLSLYSMIVEHKMIIVNGVIVAVNTYALMLTSSRAGFLTFGAIIMCLVILPQSGGGARGKEIVKRMIIIIMVLFIIVYIVQKFLPQANLDRLLNWSEYESGSGRDVRWQRALELFVQRPIFGWGWGGYNTRVGAIHNTFLTSLCDVGICGTLLLILPLVMIAIESLRQKNVLSFLMMAAGILPSFVLDAINKRFFWNAIVFSVMIILYKCETSEQISIWS